MFWGSVSLLGTLCDKPSEHDEFWKTCFVLLDKEPREPELMLGMVVLISLLLVIFRTFRTKEPCSQFAPLYVIQPLAAKGRGGQRGNFRSLLDAASMSHIHTTWLPPRLLQAVGFTGQRLLGVGSVAEFETILLEACPCSADAADEFDGYIRIHADSTTKVDKRCRLLIPFPAALVCRTISGELGAGHRRINVSTPVAPRWMSKPQR